MVSDLPRIGAEVLVPLTCGELVQGVIGGCPFLVSCPIDRFARVRVTIDATGEVVGPRDRPKAIAAATRTLSSLAHPELGATLEVSSPFSRGRGLGTSTADVVGAIVATAHAVGRMLPPGDVARLAVSVEPSDSTMFPGLASFDYRSGSHWELLGSVPDLAIVVLDFGGSIDTVAYNARLDLDAVSRQNSRHAEALALLRDGLARRDLAAIGEAATLSARANQPINPKPQLDAVLALAKRVGAFGVCCAHSGTVLGILVPSDERRARDIVGRARAAFPELVEAWGARLVDGGARARPVGKEQRVSVSHSP